MKLEELLWPASLVAEIESHYIRIIIDESEYDTAHSDIELYIFQQLHAAVNDRSPHRMLHMDDCPITTKYDESLHQYRLEIKWAPKTILADLIGGSHNGDVTNASRGLTQPIKMIEGVSPPGLAYMSAHLDDRCPDHLPIELYWYKGWNPNTRHWVFVIAGEEYV